MASTNKPNTTNGNNNSKKRKHYLPHNKAVKKKGSYPLHPGVQGFFITCDGGRERQASNEAIDVIDSFYEELLYGSKSSTRPAVLAHKPMNKKIKFSYSSSDDDDGLKGAKSHASTDDATVKNSTSEKTDPSNDDECHGNQSKEVTGDDREDTGNQGKQIKEVDAPPAKIQCLEKEAPKKDELSIDKQIQAELEELGDRNKRRFVNLDPGCNGLAFVQMHKRDGDPSPKVIAQHMMTSIAATKKHVSRFILRLLPIEVSCYASEEEISKAINPLISQYFPKETEIPKKFAVLYEARSNSGIDRMKIINAVAKSVPAPHNVDLTHPDMTIVVQIAKTLCMIGIVEKYKELSKYNLRQLSSST